MVVILYGIRGIIMKMNGQEVDKWSERHVGSLALTRTILGFINVILASVVVIKIFGWI